MVSSVDPATQAALAQLPAAASPAQQDPSGARMFADLMRGTEPGHEASSSLASLMAPGDTARSTTADLMQQMSAMHDPSDPIRSQLVMIDVLGQRLDHFNKMHIALAFSGGATGFFKQLFNRHD